MKTIFFFKASVLVSFVLFCFVLSKALQDVSGNDRGRTSENPLLHGSNESMGKIVKINVFRTLEINKN